MSQSKTKNTLGSKTNKNTPEKVRTFVEHYLMHFNAKRAYMAVFGNKNDASSTVLASQFLSRPNVQQYLTQRLAERRAQLHVDTQYVIRKLLDIVEADFVDSTQYLTKQELAQIPEEIRKLIQSIELVKTRNYNSTNSGTYENETEKYKVTFMSKDNAITLLGKHTGAFMKDNISANINMDQMTFTDALKKLDI